MSSYATTTSSTVDHKLVYEAIQRFWKMARTLQATLKVLADTNKDIWCVSYIESYLSGCDENLYWTMMRNIHNRYQSQVDQYNTLCRQLMHSGALRVRNDENLLARPVPVGGYSEFKRLHPFKSNSVTILGTEMTVKRYTRGAAQQVIVDVHGTMSELKRLKALHSDLYAAQKIHALSPDQKVSYSSHLNGLHLPSFAQSIRIRCNLWPFIRDECKELHDVLQHWRTMGIRGFLTGSLVIHLLGHYDKYDEEDAIEDLGELWKEAVLYVTNDNVFPRPNKEDTYETIFARYPHIAVVVVPPLQWASFEDFVVDVLTQHIKVPLDRKGIDIQTGELYEFNAGGVDQTVVAAKRRSNIYSDIVKTYGPPPSLLSLSHYAAIKGKVQQHMKLKKSFDVDHPINDQYTPYLRMAHTYDKHVSDLLLNAIKSVDE